MRLVNNVIDYGAPEFAVTGTAELDRISTGQIRITYYSRRHGDDGKDQNVVVCHVVWPAEEFERVQAAYRKFRMTENLDRFIEVN